MLELLLVLTPIGLLDSTSIVPLCILPLVMLLAGPQPLLRAFAFIFGIFATYVACGLLILLGLQSLLDEISAYAVRLWQEPETEELILQILLGGVLCLFGWRIAKGGKARAEKPVASGMTAPQALLAGAVLTIVGLPGAVPYFAAIDLTLRAELAFGQQVAALGFYNLVFVLPLAAIVVVRLVLGERSRSLLDRIKRFFDTWGQRVIVALLMVLGALLVADGIGWFLGTPLIPV